MFEFNHRADLGIVQLDVMGAWTREEARRYAAKASAYFAQVRRQFGRLRLLLNLAHGELMQPDVIGPLTSAGARNGRPDDLIAVVTSSPLMKLQVKRVFSERRVEMFETVEAASTWLTSHASD